MIKRSFRNTLIASTAMLTVFGALFGSIDASAQDNGLEALRQKIEAMELQLESLKEGLEKTKEAVDEAQGTASRAEKETKKAARLARAAAKAARAPDAAWAKWHLTGYADVGFVATDGDAKDSFVTGHFNPGYHFQYKDFFLFESELEIATEDDGETNIELEYSQVDLLVSDYVTFVVGKYLSPIGQFQERLHPTWIHKLADPPAGFGHGGVQPLSDTGLQLRGAIPIDTATFTYALAVGNGPRLGDHGPELEGFGSDDNGNKSFGGRLAILPFGYLEVGASYLNAGLSGVSAEPDEHEEEEDDDHDAAPLKGDYELWGVDAAFTKGNWDLRFEYLKSKVNGFPAADEEEEHHDDELRFGTSIQASEGEHGDEEEEEGHAANPNAKWRAWYVQAAYRLSGITSHPVLRNLEPVVRYGELKITGNDEFAESNEKRFNVGLNYWFAPSAVARAMVEIRDFQDHDRKDENRFQMQIAYGF